MNRNKIYLSATTALLLLVAACNMTGTDPEQAAPPDGKAAVRIGINATGIQSRTVLPAAALADASGWKLKGGIASEAETKLAEFTGTGTHTVYLEPGTWDFTLEGYKGTNLILRGNIDNKAITLEGSNTLSFTVAPVEEGAGSIKITINLPEGHGINAVKVFKDGEELSPEPVPNNNRIVYEASPAAGSAYGAIPSTYTTDTAAQNWGNAFRGMGWNSADGYGSGAVNGNISLTIEYE